MGMLGSGRNLVAIALMLVLVLVSALSASAGAPTERIREFFASVNRVIADPSFDDRPQERLLALRGLVVEIVDFRSAAAVALGPAWAARTTAERDEFGRLFTDLLQTSVFSSVGRRARIDNGLTVTYIGELADRDGQTVATSVLTRSGGEMAVGYRMALRQGRFMVHDVVIDGVSLVDNYRAQFQKVIQRSSYAGLVGEMRARIADLRGPGAPPTTMVAAPSAPGSAVVTAAPVSVPVTATAALATVPVTATAKEEVAAPAPLLVAAAQREAPPAMRAVAPRAVPPRMTSVVAYWVQVGAFRSTERARRVAAALGSDAVSLVRAPGQPLLRVLVGPFKGHEAAVSKLHEIRARGYDAFIAEATN
jgi:phospholipid transport system substrate-binding protein